MAFITLFFATFFHSELVIFVVAVAFGHKPFMPLIYYGPTNHQHVALNPIPLPSPADFEAGCIFNAFQKGSPLLKKKVKKTLIFALCPGIGSRESFSRKDIELKFNSVAKA